MRGRPDRNLGLTRGGDGVPPHQRVGPVYDFRNTSATGMDDPSRYAAIMGQVAWLDGLGPDLVWFTEHHFFDDGYLPPWIPVAGALAARAQHVRFSCAVCLLPFNRPGRLAEDLAVLDNISWIHGARRLSRAVAIPTRNGSAPFAHAWSRTMRGAGGCPCGPDKKLCTDCRWIQPADDIQLSRWGHILAQWIETGAETTEKLPIAMFASPARPVKELN